MRGLKIVPAAAALAAALGQARLPSFRAKAETGPDGTPFDGTRTTSKKTKRKMMRHPARSPGRIPLGKRRTPEELAAAAARHVHPRRNRA